MDERPVPSPEALALGRKPAEALPADSEWGSDLPLGLLAPDERWQNSMVGTRSDLEDVVRRFEEHEATPEKVSRLLLTSRNLFVHSYFVHEFSIVGALWSLHAVEAALKDLLGVPDNDYQTTFTEMVGKAQARGWLTVQEGERMRGGAKLRNGLVHSREQGTLTAGVAVMLLEASHEFVATLYERAGVSR